MDMVQVLNISFRLLQVWLHLFKLVFLLFVFCAYLNANKIIDLNKDELAILEQKGEVLSVDEVTQKGFIVFYVNENIDSVFNKLIDFNSYPKHIDDVDKVVIYYQDAHTIKSHIFVATFFISFSNWVVHNINKKTHTITWHLDDDYSESNYFKTMDGIWRLSKINQNKTMVYYSTNLEFKAYIPDFIKDILSKHGLSKATLWLRKSYKNK